VLDGFNNPAYFPRSPNSGPLYSNVGYNLLGMALAKVHGKSSEEVINELIIEPLYRTRRSTSQQTMVAPFCPESQQMLAGSFLSLETTTRAEVFGRRRTIS
jgi:hypothetical protein